MGKGIFLNFINLMKNFYLKSLIFNGVGGVKSAIICCIIIILNLIAFIPNIQAQEPITLDLRKSIDIALKKSYSIKSLKEALTASRNNLIAARAALKSNAILSLNAPRYYDSVYEILDSFTNKSFFESKGSFRTQGQIRINQPFSTNGVLSLVGTFYRDNIFNKSDRINPLTQQKFGRTEQLFSSNDLFLQYTQPIFTPNTLKMNIERAKMGLEKTEYQYNRMEFDIIVRVTESFY
ncbi:MAG: hypothetical protein ACE5QV_07615, partial [Fidelibacterota bacterium]